MIVNYCNVTTSIRHQIRILLHLTDGVKQKLQAVHQHICRQRDTDITVISQCNVDVYDVEAELSGIHVSNV